MAGLQMACLTSSGTVKSSLSSSLARQSREDVASLRPRLPSARASVQCEGSGESSSSEAVNGLTVARPSRRQLLSSAAGASLAALSTLLPDNPSFPLSHFPLLSNSALAAKDVDVGSYLPSAGVDNFVVFKAGAKDTPALRAGNVNPYSFYLPPTFVQQRIANILSGNYCQPKCAEPWIEVKFDDPKMGTLQVVASPKIRLTNKPGATIEEIGDPEKIISALGPFVTGDSFDPDEVVESGKKQVDGQTFYTYTLETPYARSGAHNLASATAKGETVLLLVISANDSQWNSNEPVLRKLLDSFRVL